MFHTTDPDAVHPIAELPNICFVKNVVKSPNVFIGEYTYYDDPVDSTLFETNNILFNWPEFGDRLVIGKFCALAYDVKFLMGPANHRMGSVSTYPFSVFGGAWGESTPSHMSQLPRKGDIVVGNDVWIGRESLIMPGVKIGDGAIVAARSVVVKDVAPYSIYGGNPAGCIRMRFDEEMVGLLERVRWWDFGKEKLLEWLPVLCNEDMEEVAAFLRRECGMR